jgi:hypothetical protein
LFLNGGLPQSYIMNDERLIWENLAAIACNKTKTEKNYETGLTEELCMN